MVSAVAAGVPLPAQLARVLLIVRLPLTTLTAPPEAIAKAGTLVPF